MTAVLNAANERANELFRGEKLGYLGMQVLNCLC
jgi:1-deoxy-D-xylulose 5-phosphate reductoisomerase